MRGTIDPSHLGIFLVPSRPIFSHILFRYRVLFSAHAPFTILHANAAYGILVQKGLAKPCIVGRSLSFNKHQEGESLQAYISRIVADHLIAFDDETYVTIEDCGNVKEGSVQPKNSLPGSVNIYNVMSSDETYVQLIHACRAAFQCEQMDNGRLLNLDASAHASFSPEHVSHTYLLQIEPSC